MKILLVEDDKKIATMVKRGLEAEGFTVEVAFDGPDGLWLATEGSYDLIILDILLPGRNGFQVCADLRESGNWTPILMLTAKDGDLDEAEALDTGADDYLTKPFSFAVLVARVRALLRRSAGKDPAPLSVGDLRIHAAQRRAWRGDTEIDLTARQFDVLEFLVRRAGQVLSKSEILDGVWEYEFEGTPTSSRCTSEDSAPGSTSLSDDIRSRPSGGPGTAWRTTGVEWSGPAPSGFA